jgi:hypothetical protein
LDETNSEKARSLSDIEGAAVLSLSRYRQSVLSSLSAASIIESDFISADQQEAKERIRASLTAAGIDMSPSKNSPPEDATGGDLSSDLTKTADPSPKRRRPVWTLLRRGNPRSQ